MPGNQDRWRIHLADSVLEHEVQDEADFDEKEEGPESFAHVFSSASSAARRCRQPRADFTAAAITAPSAPPPTRSFTALITTPIAFGPD